MTDALLDQVLAAQFAIAWAGESGETPRLAWWRCDLVSEFGGEDLFSRLLPSTWRWAVLQGAREAARRHDAELRAQDHAPDELVTLYNLGFEADERVEERLRDLKRSRVEPTVALPELRDLLSQPWSKKRFAEWVRGHGKPDYVATPVGRRIKAAIPDSLDLAIPKLLGALDPLADRYPVPHFRRAL